MKNVMPVSLLVSFLFSLTSCLNNEAEETKTPRATSPFATPPPANTPVTAPVTPAPATQPVPATTTTTNTITPQPATTPAVALNPEHGKPGHRCDIAVGAPLTSQPAQPVTQPATTSKTTPVVSAPVASAPVITPTSIPSASTDKTATGLNPEHGKPGHRCDIAVGAPLNSPAPAKTNTEASATPVVQPSISPATVAQPVTPVAPAVNEKGEQLNPEHGKPGHRCDIAVGAPLNSQPVKKQ